MSDFNKNKERVLREHLLKGFLLPKWKRASFWSLRLIRAVSRLRKMGFRFEREGSHML